MIALDTSVVIALMNRGDDDHARVAEWMEATDEELLTTPLIVAEIDRLVSRAGEYDAARAFYEDLEAGAYLVEWWPEAMSAIVTVAREYQAIGLADASLITLAARFDTNRVATLDERHFRSAQPITGEEAFTLLPADA